MFSRRHKQRRQPAAREGEGRPGPRGLAVGSRGPEERRQRGRGAAGDEAAAVDGQPLEPGVGAGFQPASAAAVAVALRGGGRRSDEARARAEEVEVSLCGRGREEDVRRRVERGLRFLRGLLRRRRGGLVPLVRLPEEEAKALLLLLLLFAAAVVALCGFARRSAAFGGAAFDAPPEVCRDPRRALPARGDEVDGREVLQGLPLAPQVLDDCFFFFFFLKEVEVEREKKETKKKKKAEQKKPSLHP